MKIRETIEGASENTVVYENSAGEVISVSRPKIFTLEQMISEIEAKEKKSAPSAKGKLPKESPLPEQTPSERATAPSKGGKADGTPEPPGPDGERQ